jgi:septal ring factor EnvC (AmiA/AmiB activator)
MGSEGNDMPTLEERATALETRVDELAMWNSHTAEVAVTAMRDALTARRTHLENLELLNALRLTHAEHTKRLTEHTKKLTEHDRRFDAVDQRLDEIHGKLGQLTVGMHTIETLLRRLADEDGARSS